MGSRTKTKEQVSSILEMDLQNKAFGRRQYREVQGKIVAREFSQKEGIDYEETFAPVATYTSLRTMLSLASKMKWKLHQMDVKTTFLNGVIEEEVYIEKMQGFETGNKKTCMHT